MGQMPSLHIVQEQMQALHLKGFEVHTTNMVLWDGHIWQVTIEASDEDCENHVFLYHLDTYGWQLQEVEAHYR